MRTTATLGRELKPGASAPDSSALLSDVVVGVDLAARPPTLTLKYRGATPFVGSPADYHTGDPVVYVPDGPGSIVVGKLQNRGYGEPIEEPDEAEEMDPWHEVGATGEPAFQGAWVNYVSASDYDTAAFYMQGDYWVRLKGLIKSGTAGSVIFTLPEGYQPVFQCYFTVQTNTGPAKLRVEPGGDVVWVEGGSSGFLSLDGVTFPTLWNRTAWLSPYCFSTWVGDAGEASSTPMMYVREDGWCWFRGVLDGGPGTSQMMLLPEKARSRFCDAMPAIGFGITRFDIGGGAGSTDRNPATFWHRGGSTGAVVGGTSYFCDLASLSSFTGIALSNGWTNYGLDTRAVAYTRDHFNVVHVVGLMDGTSKTGNVFGTLPAGYRPGKRQLFPALIQGNNYDRIDVLPDGQMTFSGHTTGFGSIGHISFRAMQ